MPFEFFMNIIAPILTAVCVGSYLVVLLLYFNLFSATLPIVLLIVTGLAVFVALKATSPATNVTLQNSKSDSRSQMITSILDLILMEFILFVSLLSLLFQGPKYKWEKIENTRRES
jgi:hypothetical protein